MAKNKAAAPQAGSAAEPLFAAAVGHHQAGRFAEAEQGYRRVLAIEPRHALSLYHLGLIALQVGQPRAAIDVMATAVALDEAMPEWQYHLALAYQSCGQADDAIRHYGHAVALDPDYAEAQTNLGIVLQAQGRLVEATACHERTLALRPDSHLSHYNLAMALAARGRTAQAERQLLAALALKGDFAEAHNNLGILLMQQGRAEEAAAHYRRAVEINPGMAEAYLNIGNMFREQGRLDEAAAQYREALARRPDLAEAHNNLGLIALARRQPAEAGTSFQQAVRLRPNFHEALLNLGRVLLAQRHAEPALAAAMDALAMQETADAKALFVRALRASRTYEATDELRGLVERALSEPWDRPAHLAVAAAELIRQNPEAEACMVRAMNAWPQRLSAEDLFGPGGLAALSGDRLLRCLLRSACIPLMVMERLLTGVRSALLDSALAARPGDTIAPELADFYGALAEHCFINGYVFDAAGDEYARALALRDQLAAALRSGDDIPALWPLAAAAYAPLHALPEADKLRARSSSGSWPEPVRSLIRQQVQEPLEERGLRAAIPRLTAIDDEVSRDVQRQYEEDPYPAWVRTLLPPSIGLEPYLKRRFPEAAVAAPAASDRLDVLVAGCGTGQQVVEIAHQFGGASVLAVDLSLASLGRASRMAASLGMGGIEFAQADILKLGSVGRSFDLIISTGVLHHLADPLAGWRVLLSLLRPQGLMLVGLYSELARQDVVAARSLAAGQGLAPMPDDIRRFRQELFNLDASSPLRRVAEARDFFNLSECRDLLFHVQEHRFTIPQIKAFLADNSLQFIGFEITSDVRQAVAATDGENAMADLDRWHAIETEIRTFPGMYQFWVQKGG